MFLINPVGSCEFTPVLHAGS